MPSSHSASASSAQPVASRVWYALQTYYCREQEASRWLHDAGLTSFVPMRYREYIRLDGTRRRVLAPAVHNLLFVTSDAPYEAVVALVGRCPFPLHGLRNRATGRWYAIADSEMTELRALCDPDYEGTLFVDVPTAEARRGSRVRVTRGPFKGLEGKLVRYKNRSYVVVVVATLGVMVHIPKWYCEVLP